MDIDWKALAPHKPIPEGDDRYVPRPEKPSLADRIAMDDSPLAVVGPAGVGKSSLLARLAGDPVPVGARALCSVPLLLDHARARMASEHASTLQLTPNAVQRWCVIVLATCLAEAQGRGTTTPELAKLIQEITPGEKSAEAIRPLARALLAETKSERLLLLLDGLERTPVDQIRSVLEDLHPFHDDLRMVVVLPSEALYGPQASWIQDRFKLHFVPAIDVVSTDPARSDAGRRFFTEMLHRRIGQEIPLALLPVVERSIALSGGIPRTFLQLIQDAANYATLAGRGLPELSDLDLAAQDHRQSLRRLLDTDDKRTLIESDGTDGSEVPLIRRARLIAHGLLLEYQHGDDLVVHPAPLLQPILRARAA